MRTPVNRIKGKPQAETIEDILSNVLSQHYKVVRQKAIEHQGQTFTADIALPEQKIALERQEKQDNKAIMAEMARERIARGAGWSIFRFQEVDVRQDPDLIIYRLRREMQRLSR
jgi:very-short-patch-repair endonuclease